MASVPSSKQEPSEKTDVLATKGQLEQALARWQQLAQSQPDSVEAATAVAQLAIELNRRRAGLKPAALASTWLDDRVGGQGATETSGQTADASAADGPAGAPPARNIPGPKLTPIQQLELAIRDQPSHAESYLKLVPLYLAKEREYDAERLLEKGKEATGDWRVRQLWEDVVLLRLDKKIEFARQEAERNDTPQARTELSQMRSERDRFAIEVFTGRCQRQPDKMALRYELGLRLQRAGKLKAACEQFQEALADAAQKSAAAFQLGQCRAQFFEYPQALAHYRLAADSALLPEQLECKKEALYRAAELAARVKLKSTARRYLEELLELDPNYSDAAGLLESMPQVVV
jgi:tetratricopeptide (TPR) repeat protein